ncbi:MAG: hypothetical protein P8Y68_01595 [Anaerolineales bacterium]
MFEDQFAYHRRAAHDIRQVSTRPQQDALLKAALKTISQRSYMSIGMNPNLRTATAPNF